MSKIKVNHYQILGVIREFEPELDVDEGVALEDVADVLGVSVDTVERVVRNLVSPLWCDGDPWLERAPRGGVWLTVAGGEILESSRAPINSKAHQWINRKRWPWTEADSATENVAIPSYAREHIRDPEREAWKHADHLLPRVDEITEDEMRAAWRKLF